MEGKLLAVTFGVASQMSEATHALRDCVQAGYWLVLQNAHLADSWDEELLGLLQVCVRMCVWCVYLCFSLFRSLSVLFVHSTLTCMPSVLYGRLSSGVKSEGFRQNGKQIRKAVWLFTNASGSS